MRFFNKGLKIFTSIALVSLAVASCTKNESADDSTYVGIYSKSDMESLSQIVLLDDHTFCYGFMGGSLDLLAAGRWRRAEGKQPGIVLHEVRANSVLFPVFAQQTKQQDGMIHFDFDGYSLSEANGPVFATAAEDVQPTVFRPMFDEDKYSWAETYSFPPVDKSEAAYFYIGQIEEDIGWQRLHIFQYQIADDIDTIRIGFDSRQASPKLKLSAHLSGNILHVDGQEFGEKSPLTEDILNEVKEGCINPVFAADADSGSENKTLLVPVKDFYLNMNSASSDPIFNQE